MFAEKTVQQDMRLWPFQVVSEEGGRPAIEVQYQGEKKRFKPEEISAMVLTKMKQTAEDYLGQPVNSAVITGNALPFAKCLLLACLYLYYTPM